MTKPNGWTGVKWLYRAKSDSVHTPSDTHPYGDQVFRFHVGYNDEEGPSESVIALVLAAPSLYEALAEVMAVFPKPDEDPSTGDICRAHVKARAALSAAGGEV